MKVISEKHDLLKLLRLLKEAEDESEKAMQQRMSSQLNQLAEDEDEEQEETPERSEEESEDSDEEASEEDESEESSEESKEDDEEKVRALPGAERLASLDETPPSTVTVDDVIERLNFIRAGASLNDAGVQKKISGYIASLDTATAQGMWSILDGLARIMLLGSDPAEVSVPGVKSQAAEVEPQQATATSPEQAQQQEQPPEQIVSPIVVGEAVARQIKDVEIPLSSGRMTSFGSQEHINDLENRIADLIRVRSYQPRGSKSKYTLSQAISSLKSELQSAKRTLEKNRPNDIEHEEFSSDIGE